MKGLVARRAFVCLCLVRAQVLDWGGTLQARHDSIKVLEAMIGG